MGFETQKKVETVTCYSVGHQGFKNTIRSSRSGTKVAVLAWGWDLESQNLGFQLRGLWSVYRRGLRTQGLRLVGGMAAISI